MSFRILPQLTCWSLLFIGLPLHTAGQDLEGISCATAPGVDARAEFVVEHNGGLVYFCNQSSANQFSADPGSHAASANYQMVRTGQFQQQACPVSGEPLAGDIRLRMGHLDVQFCCEDCRDQISGQSLAGQLKGVFGDEVFSVAFRHAPGVANLAELKCILDRSADVVANQSVEFNGGRVFFCCADCRSEFDPANPDHLAAANWQLVASGQFGQIGCPFSGQEILEEAMTPVGGVEVGFCNTGCRDKVQNATDDLERTGMVFNSEAFTRGFSRIVDSPQPADR